MPPAAASTHTEAAGAGEGEVFSCEGVRRASPPARPRDQETPGLGPFPGQPVFMATGRRAASNPRPARAGQRVPPGTPWTGFGALRLGGPGHPSTAFSGARSPSGSLRARAGQPIPAGCRAGLVPTTARAASTQVRRGQSRTPWPMNSPSRFWTSRGHSWPATAWNTRCVDFPPPCPPPLPTPGYGVRRLNEPRSWP